MSVRLRRAVERALDALAAEHGVMDEVHPVLVDPALLRKSGWLDSFPHLALHACGTDPETGAAGPDYVLAPAACHGIYHARRATELGLSQWVHVRGPVFRNEVTETPLRRQRAFTMDEVVYLGSSQQLTEAIDTAQAALTELLRSWGLRFAWHVATDPFYLEFDPKHLLQRIAPVKWEAVLVGDDLAIASVNLHHAHFGDAFDITLDGDAVHSGCVATGVERVVWALLAAHGSDVDNWPEGLAA